MKKNLLSGMLVAGLFSLGVNAQNTFPATGNVGIGTPSPQEHLQIGNAFTLHSGGHKLVSYNYPSTGKRIINGHVSSIRFDDLGNIGFEFAGYGLANSTVTPIRTLTINSFGIGIGTPTPSDKLHIKDGGLIVEGLSNTSGGRIELKSTGNINNSSWIISHGVSSTEPYINKKFSIGTNTMEPFVINQDGRVSLSFSAFIGKGTSTPTVPLGTGAGQLDYALYVNGMTYVGNAPSSTELSAIKNSGKLKLFVNGTIGTKEVIVSTTNWADYVFNKDYKLKSLKEVDAFIQANKHLPEVPSEKEVVENGVAMGEMMKIHMKKIEELTLYMIELQKQNEKLAAEVAELKK